MPRDVSKYRLAGVDLPSVTECLDRAGFQDLSRIPWAVLEEARVRGVAVHTWLELLVQHPEQIRGLSPPEFIRGYIDAWERWRIEARVEILCAENVVLDAVYRYAGTLDLGATVGGRKAIVDYKARYGITPEVGPQVAGYLGAARDSAKRGAIDWIQVDEPVDRYCLLLRPDGTYRFEHYTDRHDLTAFRHAVGVMHWQLAHGLVTLAEIRRMNA